MPLNKTGEKLLRKFRQEYGKKKGKSAFYAKEYKDKDFAYLVKHKHCRKKG